MASIGDLTRRHVARVADSTLSEAKAYTDTAETNACHYADSKVADLVDGAPETLDTLKEIADELARNETALEAITAAVQNHTHDEATTSAAGFMPATDKAKLDSTGSETVSDYVVGYFERMFKPYANGYVGTADDFTTAFDAAYNG